MPTSRIIAAAVLALASCLACSSSTGCNERTEIVEIVWGAIDEGIQEFRLRTFENGGYDCVAEPLRNGLGTQIGTRNTCTICD